MATLGYANEAIVNSLGATGSKEITGTSAVAAPTGYYYFALQPIDDIKVATAVSVTGTVNADITVFTTISTVVYGKWTSITLTSGSAIGYLARL